MSKAPPRGRAATPAGAPAGPRAGMLFGKAAAPGSRRKVGGSERKRLRRELAAGWALGEDALEAVLPAKPGGGAGGAWGGDLEAAKLRAPSRGIVWLLGGCPLAVDPSGHGDPPLVPSVFALWACPRLLPSIVMRHPDVAVFLLGGADLMLPGVGNVDGGWESLRPGELRQVLCPGNPAAVAVGRVLLGAGEAAARGGKGKLLEVLHHAGDALWPSFRPEDPCPRPNEGFISRGDSRLDANRRLDGSPWGAVVPLGGLGEGAGGGGEADELGGAGESGTGPRSDGEGGAAAGGGGGLDEEVLRHAGGGPDGDGGGRGDPPDPLSQNSQTPAPAAMDALLQESLLQALKTVLKKDSALPVAGSVLWNRHMQAGRRAGARLDLAASSYGKKGLGAFLEAQKAAGLVHLKRDKRSGELSVTGVERRHPAYRAFQPWSDTAAAAEADLEAAEAQLGALQISCLFRAAPPLEPLFPSDGRGRLYSREEVAAAAGRYVETHGLAAMEGGVVLLDAPLAHALFQGAIKKGQPVPQHVPARDLSELILRRMLPQNRLVRGHLSAVRKGELPEVHVRTEKRAGSRAVTIVRGLEAYLVDPEAEAAALAKLLACSASCVEVPGKQRPGLKEVVVQGEVVRAVVERLASVAVGVPRARIAAPAEKAKGKGKPRR